MRVQEAVTKVNMRTVREAGNYQLELLAEEAKVLQVRSPGILFPQATLCSNSIRNLGRAC